MDIYRLFMIILLDMGVFEHINQWYLFSIFGWPCGVRGPVFPSSAKPCDIQVPNKKSIFSIRCYSSSIINPFWSKTKQQKQQTSIYIHDFPVITPICSKNHLQHHSTSIFHWEKPFCFLFHWMFATDATDLLEVPHTDLLPGQVQVICALTELSSDRRSMCFGEWMACVTGDFWQIYDTCVVSMDWCNVYATSTCIWMYIYIYINILYIYIYIYILYICIWWICVCYFRVYSCYSRDIRYTHMHIMFLATMIYHILFPDFQLNSLAGLAGFNFVGGYRSLAMRWSNKNREIDPEQWRHEPIGTWRTQKKQRDGLKHTNPGCHLHHPEVITSFMGAVNTVNHPQSCYIGLWQGCSHYITLLPKKRSARRHLPPWSMTPSCKDPVTRSGAEGGMEVTVTGHLVRWFIY